MSPSIETPEGNQNFVILDGDVNQYEQRTKTFVRRGTTDGVGVIKQGRFAKESTLTSINDVPLLNVDLTLGLYQDMVGSVAVSITNSQGNNWTNVLIVEVELIDAPAAEGIVGGNGTSGAIMTCAWRVRQL